MRTIVLTLIITVFSIINVTYAANTDAKGSSDHPLISRFPETHITSYHTSEYQEFMVATGPITSSAFDEQGKTALPPVQKYEGNVTVITYEANEKSASALAIYRNFEKAFAKNQFVKTFSCESDAVCGPGFARQLYWYGDPARQGQNKGFNAVNTRGTQHKYYYWTGTAQTNENNYFVSLIVAQHANSSHPARIVLDVNQVESLNEDRILINLNSMRDNIQTTGKAILDGIFFDHNKSTLTSESASSVAVIADYLKQYPSLNFYVVGHTDSEGSIEYNQNLSKSRAESVIAELTSSLGVDSKRLQAYGVGPVSPVTSNESEEGRALNRRVELVLQN